MFPTLFAKNKNGVLKSWTISIQNNEKYPVIYTEYGQKNGKKIISTTEVKILKKGYSSLHEMAHSMAKSKWMHKKERENYHETEDSLHALCYLPMLAKPYEGGKNLVFPIYVQPKVDGLRCIAFWDGKEVRLTSRTNVLFTSKYLNPLRKELSEWFQTNGECVLDGELYSHQMPFEQLSGAIRNTEAKEEDKNISIIYMIFDVIDEKKTFEERFIPLKWKQSDLVQKLETFLVGSLEEVNHYHSQFLREGYEGSILRNRNGKYKKGFRSWDLQKKKDFLEEEFEIVGFTEGESGREKGTVIWECKTFDDKTFRVRPRGNLDYRKKLFKEGQSWIGSFLTVIYQELTNEGIPRFPVGKEIRKNY